MAYIIVQYAALLVVPLMLVLLVLVPRIILVPNALGKRPMVRVTGEVEGLPGGIIDASINRSTNKKEKDSLTLTFAAGVESISLSIINYGLNGKAKSTSTLVLPAIDGNMASVPLPKKTYGAYIRIDRINGNEISGPDLTKTSGVRIFFYSFLSALFATAAVIMALMMVYAIVDKEWFAWDIIYSPNPLLSYVILIGSLLLMFLIALGTSLFHVLNERGGK